MDPIDFFNQALRRAQEDEANRLDEELRVWERMGYDRSELTLVRWPDRIGVNKCMLGALTIQPLSMFTPGTA